MERYKNQIVFVSRENAAELEGALWPGSEAARVHAVVTDEMREKGEALKAALESRGVRCETHRLPEIRQKAIEEILERIRAACGEESLALNLTGGTKLMTLAAYDWAYATEMPAFYMDGSRLVRIRRGGWEEEPIPPDILDMRLLFMVYGYRITRMRDQAVGARDRETLAAILNIAGQPAGSHALACLNGAAQTALERRQAGSSLVAQDCQPGFSLWQRLLEYCRDAGKLDYANGEIMFASEEARKWCNGGWLEDAVQMVLYRLKNDGRITSFGCGVEVQRNKGDGGVNNELDAVFSRNNRLHVIECKTARLGSQGKGSSILYKADSLNDRIGGIFTRSLLCSVDALSKAETRRARHLNIKILSGRLLGDLEKELDRWSNEKK